jgi:lysozyme family protein
MADFKIAEAITGFNEGGYANNKADTGGETMYGIARNYWGKWKGWAIIDDVKRKYGITATIINKHAKADENLHDLVSDFYKNNFWDVNKLDRFEDQQIANTVYDFGVNSGTGRSAKFLQEILSVIVDGKIGNQTISAVNSGNKKAVHEAFNCKRNAFYNSIAVGNQKQFLKSWLSRVKKYK